MGLVMFYSQKNLLENIGLPRWTPPFWPWVQCVNRSSQKMGNNINAFKYTLKCETVEEIIDWEPQNKLSFEEQIETQALNLKLRTEDKNVYLMYSGGIDSTGALVSMMNTWGKDIERLHILMSYRSIAEFPDLWPVINKKFKGRIINSIEDNLEQYYSNGYIVTGEHGDQIFGSDQILKANLFFGKQCIHDNYEKYLYPFYTRQFKNLNYLQRNGKNLKEFIDLLKWTTEYSPIEIKTLFDWVWWVNFTNKWQLVKYRNFSFSERNDNLSEPYSKFIHFFDTTSWQRWSIDNHHLKIKDNVLTYKYPAKEYIVKKTGLDSYLNKPKVGSLQHVWKNFTKPDGIDENFNKISLDKCLEFLNND
jgi:hypothetical protein